MKRFVLLLASFLLVFSSSAALGGQVAVIVRCGDACDQVATGIAALGGEVTYRYTYVKALAATVPDESRGALLGLPGALNVYKDLEMALPEPAHRAEAVAAGAVGGAELDAVLGEMPANYLFNNTLTGATALHAAGHTGDGVIVAVIDSGTVNRAGHALTGKVIGGENLVPGATEPSATSSLNGSHGTWVGCMIAAEGLFLFSDASVLAQSLKIHAPDSIIPCDGLICPLGLNIVPMIGTAPDAQLYALKVFAAAGGGSPTSRTIAAMERAITLKRNYNAGMPSVPVSGDGSAEDPFVYDSLNIQVVNMSLTGGTLYAAHELDEELTQVMLDVGITMVGSAGNDGHAAMTAGGPATGRGALAAGAASTVAHERVLRDLQFGLGIGAFYRPSDHLQMATFSSRGPSADGRVSTDLIANGFASFVHGVGGCCSLVSGTSFSGPTLAGAAALLRGAVPTASAVEVRGALVQSANPALLGDNPAPIDQGAGFVDLPAALALLQAGGVDTRLPKGTEGATVKGNIASLGLKTINPATGYSTRIEDLMPGKVAHFFVEASPTTDRLSITLENVDPELPPGQQNVFFGDDLLVEIVDAPTSFDFVVGGGFIASDTTFDVDQPQTGLIRVGVMGDWTNAGRISADLRVEAVESKLLPKIAGGKVERGELDFLAFEVPAGATRLVFDLMWTNDWSAYPTDDLDLILIDPGGNLNFDGATLSSPERVDLASPAAGVWTVVVQGFTVHGVHGGDASHWELRAAVE